MMSTGTFTVTLAVASVRFAAFARITAVHPRIDYSVTVKRDVPVVGFFGLAFLALLIPAIALTWRRFNFERRRWAESDHPLVTTGSSSSEDD